MKTCFKVFWVVLVCAWAMGAYAQKLPNIQKESVYAPGNTKIDGNATEWNNQFQAYNHATDIYYTIANDDKNLYLAVQATEPQVINRIAGGGITLSINKYGNKKDKNNINITYPVTEDKSPPRFLLAGRSMVNLSGKKVEDMMVRYNKIIEQSFKWIKITGITGLDEMISIYNQDGIKAAGLFDNNKHYTYEFSVPLKYLDGLIGSASKFTYHIVVNGRKQTVTFETTPGEKVPPMLEKMAQMSVPTDFWGEYTLAKK